MSLHLPFVKLSHWQQIAFSAALLERMLPNYQMFSEASDFGDAKVLRNQLDIIWQWLANRNAVKINIDAQLLKLEPQTPDPEVFDSFGVFPALDACMALTALWQLMQLKAPKKNKPADIDIEDIKSISRLSFNSVSYYVELLLLDEAYESEAVNDGEEIVISEVQMNEHPLVQWEKDTQNELFDFLKFAAEDKKSCGMAKNMSLSEGLSSLGIEIA
ncbi:YjaG family protein [Colwellia sp. E2M01]|uniref:YjaG family protein n=1 Tax=Colwellia sp. E2M01 TaxID=2841561 RepID=UPI001C09990F|nr:YjaG family protein [Colwellia sp. E2M01]